MRTVRRLIYVEVLYAVLFVTVGFLSLFFFFDLVDELPAVGRDGAKGYQIRHALLYVTMLVPNHLYELLPIAVLIGSVFVMARLAQSSEYTILRTSGLGPWRALKTLLQLGLVFVALTFVIGDYVAPPADRVAQLLRARYQGRLTIGQTGAWLKERQPASTASVNVRAILPDGNMSGVRIFEFDRAGFFKASIQADKGVFGPEAWTLINAERTEFGKTAAGNEAVIRTTVPEYRWATGLSSEMVSAAVLNPTRMRTIDLFVYMRHLEANRQSAQRYEIEFWRKVFYPLSCLVMVVLALPFAYLHFRSGSVAGYVFGGVMAGISFFLLNNVFGFIGNLQNWLPWLTAAAPSLLYSVISLAAFGWLVLRR
jgi:lipopolysaccharide export system permease protein